MVNSYAHKVAAWKSLTRDAGITVKNNSSGTYLVRVTMDDGSSFSDKVVKK
jgi:hypothetical protein